jgi:lysophospholipase L1-like esterase
MRRSFTASIMAAALAVTGAALGAAPAQAATPTLNVVALGDSYGSGTGAGDYLGGTGVPGGCWRSANSYSETVVTRLRNTGWQVSFANVTCSGAATADLYQTFKGEPPQLDALDQNTNVVFLSVGTNDIDFATYGATCVLADCSGAVTQAELAELPAMGQNVAALLGEIKTRSPKARIVLTGYGSQLTPGANAPDVPLDPICAPEIFTSQERIDGNQVASGLDATLRQTARQAGVRFASPYVDSVAPHPSFAGHSLCESAEPYYRGFDALAPGQEGQEAILHLNQAGQTALATLALRKLY